MHREMEATSAASTSVRGETLAQAKSQQIQTGSWWDTSGSDWSRTTRDSWGQSGDWQWQEWQETRNPTFNVWNAPPQSSTQGKGKVVDEGMAKASSWTKGSSGKRGPDNDRWQGPDPQPLGWQKGKGQNVDPQALPQQEKGQDQAKGKGKNPNYGKNTSFMY